MNNLERQRQIESDSRARRLRPIRRVLESPYFLGDRQHLLSFETRLFRGCVSLTRFWTARDNDLMPYYRPMPIVFAAIAAIAITALGFTGAVWGVSWFMHSPFVWRTISSGWFQAISDSLILLVPIAISIYAAIVVRGRTPRRGAAQ